MRQIVLCLLLGLVVVPCGRADKVVLVAGGPNSAVISPFGVDFDKAGHLYEVEMTANRVARIDAGAHHVIAGTGLKGNSGDGANALAADMNGPHSLAVGPDD